MPFTQPPRFEVDVWWGAIDSDGELVWVPIYRGNDEKIAVEKADFWDYYCDVRYVDWELRPWREQMARKFDALEKYIRNWTK